mmetsp:Transcript_416/g.900  ORF Transcript_416/g.900 Transcript_416/m.900 type:complete len:384 (+) Transcript_416:427-1578(+)
MPATSETIALSRTKFLQQCISRFINNPMRTLYLSIAVDHLRVAVIFSFYRFQPFFLFPRHVQNGFLCTIRVALVGKHAQPRLNTKGLEGGKIAFALQRMGSRVLVHLSVNQQQFSDALLLGIFFHVHQRAHGNVRVLGFPDASVFGLKGHGGQCSVEGTASSNPRRKQAGMRQQMRRHEAPIGMSSHGTLVGVGDTAIGHVFDSCRRARHDLVNKGIVGVGIAFANDGQGKIVHDHPSLGSPVDGRCPVGRNKSVFASLDLACRFGIFEFPGIRPKECGAWSSIVVRWKVQVGRQINSVLPFVLNQFFFDTHQVGLGMRKGGNGSFLGKIAQRREIVIGWRGLALSADENRIIIFQKHHERFVHIIPFVGSLASYFRWCQWIG